MDSSFTPYVRKFGDWHEWHEIKMITPVVVGIKKQNREDLKEIIINVLRSSLSLRFVLDCIQHQFSVLFAELSPYLSCLGDCHRISQARKGTFASISVPCPGLLFTERLPPS
jgi:hypothetical protein